MAFQRIGEKFFAHHPRIVAQWLQLPDLLDQRCILASLAHPLFLDDSEGDGFCLETTWDIFSGVSALHGPDLKTGE